MLLNRTILSTDYLSENQIFIDFDLLNDYSIEAADSIIELYLLAKCDKIFGTPGSTFSGLANRIGCFPID